MCNTLARPTVPRGRELWTIKERDKRKSRSPEPNFLGKKKITGEKNLKELHLATCETKTGNYKNNWQQ